MRPRAGGGGGGSGQPSTFYIYIGVYRYNHNGPPPQHIRQISQLNLINQNLKYFPFTHFQTNFKKLLLKIPTELPCQIKFGNSQRAMTFMYSTSTSNK